MQIESVSSISVIAPDPGRSRELFVGALGLPLEQHEGTDYWSSEHVPGSRHFGVWPLAEAAQACYGTATWPEGVPVPQASIEFELASPEAVGEGAEELAAGGHELLHGARTEPWGQTVARLLSPEGLVVGLSYAPWMHG